MREPPKKAGKLVPPKKPGLKAKKQKGIGKKGKQRSMAKVISLEEYKKNKKEEEVVVKLKKRAHEAEREEIFRHAHHSSQGMKKPAAKVLELDKVRREIEEIDQKTLKAIKESNRQKAKEDVAWLRGVRVELAAEFKKLERIKRNLRSSKKREKVPAEGQIEWINNREAHIRSQIKRVNSAIKGLTQMHDLRKGEGGEPAKITRIKHVFGFKKAA